MKRSKFSPYDKVKLILRLIAVVTISYGLIEVIEAGYHKLVSPTDSLMLELAEICSLTLLLVLLIYRFVITPISKEMMLRKESEEQLQHCERIAKAIMDAFPDSILNVASDGTIINFRPAQSNIINFEAGKNVCDVLQSATLLEFLRCLNAVLKDGKPLSTDLLFYKEAVVNYYVFNFVKSGEDEIMVFIRDITKRKIYEEKLEHISTHDVLTGLYNRTFYEAEIDRLASSRRYPISIIIIDLDGLKKVNDTLGHTAGDKMICKAADILRSAFRSEDMVARTGGDEFTVLLPETDNDGLNAAMARINKSLEEANLADDDLEVGLSIGGEIAQSKEGLHEAIRIADLRMYHNKAERKTVLAAKPLSKPINS